MKKPAEEYTDEEINKMLEFSETLMFGYGEKRELPKHLEKERKELLAELLRRKFPQFEDRSDMIEI
jgi:hypothetical protein